MNIILKISIPVILFTCLIIALILAQKTDATAIPKFSRMYNVSCGACHVIPPKLNSPGQEFVARRYQFSDERPKRPPVIPVSVWASYLGQQQPGKDFMRGFPNRIEFIASDAISAKLSYFVEWRALSLELRADGSLRDRSGRFEDLFVVAEVMDNVSVTVGQFRLLSQIDVSQRLSISEPLSFSSGLRGTTASTNRLTGLRSFSPAGRSPTLRVEYHNFVFNSKRQSDGWFTVFNLPMTGEFSIPLTSEARREASFEFEAVPKGVFIESFLRKDLSSVGVHLFTGTNNRMLGQVVGTTRFKNLFLSSAFGVGKDRENKLTNMMLEAEYKPVDWGILAVRFEHQTGFQKKPSIIPYGVVHFPGTSYTVRLSIEQKIQEGNNQTLVETGVIF